MLLENVIKAGLWSRWVKTRIWAQVPGCTPWLWPYHQFTWTGDLSCHWLSLLLWKPQTIIVLTSYASVRVKCVICIMCWKQTLNSVNVSCYHYSYSNYYYTYYHYIINLHVEEEEHLFWDHKAGVKAVLSDSRCYWLCNISLFKLLGSIIKCGRYHAVTVAFIT